MSIRLTSCLLWIMFISRVIQGQSNCDRTNRQPNTKCVAECDPVTGCSGAGEKCLCDGDCGYSCVKKGLSCRRPPRVVNAMAKYPSTNFGAIVTYVCNKGFTLTGASQRTCRAVGKWDGVGPNCLKVCTVPDIPFSMYIAEPKNYNRTYSTGEKITLACKKGFKKKANGNPVRICISGRWTQFPFECEGTHACKRTVRPARTKCTQECSPESGCGSASYECLCDGSCGYSCVEKGMSCGDPPAITNGKLNSTGTKYNSTSHYTCDEGYSLNTDPDKRCTAKKRWSGLTPRCMKDCADPAIPRHANISNPSDKYNSGYKVTFKCNEGYNQEGIATQMCFQGKWTVLPFKCSEGGCGDPGIPTNGRKVGVSYSVNSRVYFSCDLGYELVGSEERKCQTNGIWTGQQPVCTVVDCGFPPRPKNGRLIGNQTKFQSEIQFQCDEGYYLIGAEKRMCTSDKNWSGKEVTCNAVDCGQLLPPMNGSLTGEETTYPSQVEISCDEGFILRGSHRRKCQANKKWNGTDTFCDAVDCGPLLPPKNGSSMGKETTFTKTITFKCDAGFDLIGSFSRSCMANKTWSGIMPVCKAVDCGRLSPPMNGSLLGEETTYPNQVEITCDEGFILRGSRNRICQVDRTWSGDNTFCGAVTCGKPTLPDHGSFAGTSTRYPHSITFSCEIGYEIEGSAVRRCQANGIWSGDDETRCKPVDCGPLEEPINGTKIGKKTTFKSIIQFGCDDGFDLLGAASRTCQANKQWTGRKTICSAKDCGPLSVPVNGSSSGKDTMFPNVILFSCDVGFIMIGSQTRRCQSNGIWSGNATLCKAEDCGYINTPQNGSKGGDETTYPHFVEFSCDEGFVMLGSSLRNCLSNGTWSGEETQCQAKDCGPLSVPVNGSSSGQDTTFPNVILFSCDVGFIMFGSQMRRCQSNGIWSGNVTSCKAEDCGYITTPQNGSKVGDKTTYPHSTVFSCDEGFVMLGSRVRNCLSNGTWSGEETQCQAKDCGPLSVPVNGSSFGQETKFPSIIFFSCDAGFIMIGSQSRRCQPTGIWSGNETSCEAVECGPLVMPMNGSSYGDLTIYPSKVYFQCDKGYTLKGSSVRTCLANGSWSGSNTSCEARDCGNLPVPMNGSLIGNQTTFPNKLFFICHEGFDLIGSTVRSCEANGRWSGAQPTCDAVDCGALPILLNGSQVGNLTTYPNEVTAYCDEGFLLRGSAERVCQTNRTWSGIQTSCEAVDCGSLSAPLNGSAQGSATIFPNLLKFSCDSGFILDGPAVRRCQANGTWSGRTTLCKARDCGNLSVPKNGSITGNQTTYPNKLYFSCDDGFNLIGSAIRKCEAAGRWSGKQPTCKARDCGKLPVPTNGSIIGKRTTYPNRLSFSCDDGFDLIGSIARRCEAGGNWSGQQPTCKAVDCGPLRIPVNGSVQGNKTHFPNVMKFACDIGFILQGSDERQCEANGSWSGSQTLCKAVDCGQVQPPKNGSLLGNYTFFPNKLHFYCDVGFILRGSSVRSCLANATWSGTETKCEAKNCGSLTTPMNGSMFGRQTTFPSQVRFTCDGGFLITGPEKRKCQADGTWSGNVTSCEAVDCGILPVPVNGSSHGHLTVFPESIRLSCDTGFIISGSPLRHCQANGTWSGNEAICNPVDCGRLLPPVNGSVYGEESTYPNTIQFACDEGFTLHGATRRNCQSNGTWSGSETLCQANDCGLLAVPRNGSSVGNTTTYPNKIVFSCDEGFILIGSAVRQCQANKTWNGLDTYCKAIDCGPLAVPINGSSAGDLTVFPNKKLFMCDPGYILGGSSERVCQANGTWSGTYTTCTAIDCGFLSAPRNGSTHGERTTYPNTVRFSCDKGYTLFGSTKRTCQTNGAWSGTKAVCKANDCGPLAVPRNGSSVGNTTTYPNKIVFSCDDGFILIGSAVRQCQANKSWNGLDTYCKAVDCGPLRTPVNGSLVGNLTVFPNSVLFVCEPGFILGGSVFRACQANGTWGGLETKCSAVDCGPLVVPKNGSVFGEKTMYPNLLNFKCDEGFTLHGSHARKCQANGTWSGVKTFCQANDCGPLSDPMNGTSSGNLTTYPNKVIFTCDDGFILQGSAIRQCQPDKRWSGNNTLCEAVDCGPLRAPLNGSLIGNLTVFPNSVQLKCDSGFILSGSTFRTCQANGSWSGLETACSAVDCGLAQTPRNGTVLGELTTYPNVFQFYCDEGFTLYGSSARKCQANGRWSGTTPFCQENDCGPLSVPINGTLLGNLTTYPNKVTFTCDEGFILQGSAIRHCQPDKRWSGNDTFCKAKDCGPLAVPVNGSSIGSQTTFPHQIIFSCDEGFIITGSAVRKCQSNGTWNGSKSYCEAKDCGVLDTPSNGSLFGNLTTYPNEVKFACDEGYNLRGSKTRQCLSAGNWSGNKTLCQAEDCGPLRTPTNGSSSGGKTTYPNRITFRCDEGFILRGSVIRRCQPNGTWSGDMTSCEAKNCGPLYAPINGSSVGNEFTFPNKITFKCDEGFILKGSHLRQCQSNGQWTGNNTFCQAVDCGRLSSPMNGSLSGNLTVYPNSVLFKCDPGFILRGSFLRKCQSNGTWDGYDTICEAVDCGKLHAPQNGTVIGTETTFPNILQFSCDEGFNLSGSWLRRCQTNGTWSGNRTQCQAQNCGPLPVPRNGSLIGNLTIFPNMILFDCDEGFNLRGSNARQCQANGMWSGNQTFCEAVDCGPLSVPMNGSSSGNSTVFPNSVLFKCDPGFIRNGPSTRTCQSNGTWSGLSTVCVAVDCGQPQLFLNGSITGESTVYPSVMQLSCDEGFTLRGSPKIKCHTNGTWSKTTSFCEAKDCGPLSVPLNGSYTGSKTTFPNKVTFRCDEGFILNGSKLRRCRADGSWSGNDTSCEAVDCGPLSVPLNGSLTGDSTVFPYSVLFNCDPGFSLNGSSTRTCQANGSWSGLSTTCFALDCGPLPVPTNGSSFGNLTIFPNKMQFGCDGGFNLKGSNIRHCQENGTWSGNQTFCEAVDCGPLTVPMNGSSSGDSTVFPNNVLFNCDSGFILNGSSERTCQANGIWSGYTTVCRAVDCGPFSVPMNGSFSGDSTVFPNRVLFDCDPGFILHGSSTRKCQANGTWSGLPTACIAVDCGQPQPLQNGSVTGERTVYPNVMHLSCDKGFILSGSPKIKCQTNGTWSKPFSSCVAKDCGLLAVPLNGSLTGNKTTFPNKVSFSCDNGFVLNGSSARRCQVNGSWSGTQTSCKAVNCGLLSVPMNGSSSGDSAVFPNSLQFNCDPGFILNGSSTRTCQANGTWSGLSTACVAVDCGQPEALQNGTITGQSTVYPNVMQLSCDEGFILRGSEMIQCQTNGNWSKSSSFCEAKDCGPLFVPLNGSYTGLQTTFPNEAFFSCDEGFILHGSMVRRCQSNGTWSGKESFCEAVDCGPLSFPKNGSSSGDSTVFPNSVRYKCNPGFILNGSLIRTCQANGTWSGFPVVCDAVDCGKPQPLQNGSITGQSTVYPIAMQLSCDEGFILRGSPKIQCQTNGTWSKTLSYCEAKDCGPLLVPLNGSHTGRETTFPNEASFSCDDGFILHGSLVRRCLSNGTWSGKDTFCEAVDCGPLSVPTNGSSSGNSTLFPNSVLFKCNPGFILHQSSKRTCQANGTWSGLPTTCVAQDCGPLSVPTNGSSTGYLTIFPNKILFGCDKGFHLKGSHVRQCQANGMWSGNQTFCEAVDCGPLSVPMNGSSAGDSTVFPNSVHFNCDSGFILNGSIRRTCQANGTWSGVPTVCNAVDCGPLSVPMNGSSSGDYTVFPNSVIFTCDPGFILNGSSTRTCQANRTWNGYPAVCVAVDCGQPQPIQNGSITGGSTVYPNVMQLICEEGFILRGSPDMRCQTNGTWSKTSSFCEARDCGPLTVPENGSYYGSETTFPNVATFSCDEGFVLNGSTIRQCQADGYWSGTDTLCQAVNCGPLSTPRNGALLGSLTFFPSRVQFFCNDGYILSGSSSRKCLANGTWSGIQTNCTAIDCGPPQPLLNGTLSGEMTDYPNIVKLTCDMGFILRGPPLIKCQENGAWSWIGAFCEAKNCGQLPKPLNGTVLGSETTYPNKVEFKCDEGFELQGSSTRKCEADGQWSGQEVTCQAVDCGPITVPEHALSHGNSSTYPSVITLSCQQGFSLHGESTRMCQTDGKWTSGQVSCRGMNCGLLAPPKHGWIFGSKTTHPHNMSFTCANGYRLVGPLQRTCLRNGSWSGQQPKCLAYWCSKAPEVPVFAYQTWRAARPRYEHGERIYYSCKAGFIMVGTPVRVCTLGQWSAVKFNCSVPSCNSPTVPKLSYTTAARGSQNKYLDGEKVYYSCHSGYKLVGIPVVECQNGVWTYPSFTCLPVSCGTLPKPSNGAIQRNTGTIYTTLYVFRCNAVQGYIMRGSRERRCLANATWSGEQPVCYMQTCGPRGKPRYGKVTPELSTRHFFGATIHYQCNDGFSVRGHKTSRCQIYGNWSNPVPECISCSSALGLRNRMIFSSQLSASSERDSRHRAKHGRLHGNSAWCSARSSLEKFFQIDFGRTTEVTAIATQGHPTEYKWVMGYVLKYSLGKQWLTYQESGRDKVFQGNRNGNTVVKHYLKERLVTKRLRILRHQNSQDFMGSTVCLRAEVYGCYFDSGCLAVGSEVFARWSSFKKHTRYFHGFITKIRKTSVEVTPSGSHGARVNDIQELPRAEKHYVVINKKSKPAEITTGAEVIVASEDDIGFSQGKVGRILGEALWFEVELGTGKSVWRKADDIRLLKSPVYCDRE